MSQDQNRNNSQYLRQCRADLKTARENGDQHEISRTAANLGYALFQMRNQKEGLRNFNEAIKIASELEDQPLKIYCLGIKTSAYQIVDRPTDAFKTAQEIETVADEINDLGVKCDALASQGQILLDNGASDVALEKIEQALKIAQQIDDKRRLMNAEAVFGNLSLSMASVEQAEDHFNQALSLAQELEDRTAEIGFLGNLGIVAEWKGRASQSVEIFQEVLEFVQESGDKNAQIQALRHLIKGYEKLKDDQKIFEYAALGLELTKDKPNEITFAFSETLISADYRLGRFKDAHQATITAIELARSISDDVREVNLLLSLGESYMMAEMYEEALETYQQARDGANKIHRSVDSAYLTGRIGVALAELARIDEAIAYHQEAVELAKQNNLPELAGEQLTMLTLAYLDKDMLNEAHSYCQAAIEIFTSASLDQQAYQARKLDAKIDTLVTDEQGD